MTQWALIIEDKEHCFTWEYITDEAKIQVFPDKEYGIFWVKRTKPENQTSADRCDQDDSKLFLILEACSMVTSSPFLSMRSKGETRCSFDQLLSINQHLTIGSNKTRWRHHSLLTTPPRDTGKATLAVTPMSLHHSNPYKRIPENLSAATASPPFSS